MAKLIAWLVLIISLFFILIVVWVYGGVLLEDAGITEWLDRIEQEQGPEAVGTFLGFLAIIFVFFGLIAAACISYLYNERRLAENPALSSKAYQAKQS